MNFTNVTNSTNDDELPQPSTFQNETSKSPSRATQVKSEITKHFLEQHFQDVFRESSECKQRHRQFRDRLQRGSFTRRERKTLKSEFAKSESNFKRVRRRTLRADQFTRIKLIGQGAFGDVWIVRDKEDNQIYAMKILRKTELVKKNQILNTLAERDFLTQANNPWSVQLFYSFVDQKNLYLVMEYLPGGDLMNLLIKRGVLTETETKFFVAETLMAIHHVHLTGFIHRDLKPDNLLLTKDGKIRLTDFGLSTKMDRYSDPLVRLIDDLTDVIQEREGAPFDNNSPIRDKQRREQVCSTVGTPDYIAPEVLLKKPYSQSVDFWSLGAIMYEMLFGSPPFLDDTSRGTALRIIKWRDTLKFPDVPPVSQDAIDLIQKLLCNEEKRLDFEGIKGHRFFTGIDWNNLQDMESPYIPTVQSEIDTSNFDEFEPREEDNDEENEKDDIIDLAFMGFRYNKRAKTMTPKDIEIFKEMAQENSKKKKDKKDKSSK